MIKSPEDRLMSKLILLFILISGSVFAQTNVIIDHRKITKFAYPGETILFAAEITPINATVSSVTLMYKTKGDQVFNKYLSMWTNNPSIYMCEITNTEETKYSLEYRIKVLSPEAGLVLFPDNENIIMEILPREEDMIDVLDGGEVLLADDKPNDKKYSSIKIPPDAIYEETVIGIEYYPQDTIFSFISGNNYEVKDNAYMSDNTLPLVLYRCYKKDGSSKMDFAFKKKCTITLRYFLGGFTGNEDNLHVFFWDGLYWKPVYSIQDKVNSTFQFQSDFISIFGIFSVDKTGGIKAASKILDYISKPSFSPKHGDIVIFGIKEGISEYTIKIMDYTGKVIREFNTSSWDGRDLDGEFVSTGVYIYQITAEGNTVSGSICVIK